MKRITILIWPILLFVLLGCADIMDPSGTANDILVGGTKSPASDYYYWYNGEKVDLTVNEDYVNILVDTTKVKKSDIAELCSDLSLEVKSEINAEGLFKAGFNKSIPEILDYEQSVERLRRDERILCVLPYFEAGKGKEPIGTAQYFFVRLKELSPEDTPYLEKDFDFDALQEESERLGARIVNEVAYMPDWYRITIEGSVFKTTVEAAARFYETGRFVAVDPAFMLKVILCATNDPYFNLQWGLKNTTNPDYDINVEGAWLLSTGYGRKVAVVDSGIDPNHVDLAANLYNSNYDVSIGGPYNYPYSEEHGTHIAGIIGAVGNNNTDIAGVAYNAELMRVRMVLSNPIIPQSTLDQIASGISWAWANGADVINCSWTVDGVLPSIIFENAVENALNNGRLGKGTVVVFSSGNEGSSSVGYPNNSNSRIITVGAINNSGYRDYESNYGPVLDVVAPGINILSTLPFDMIGYDSGTSMAAAHVSGIAALVLAINPYLSGDEVVRLIQHTAKKISPGSPATYTYGPRDYYFADETWNQEVGHGLVDATAAVTMAQHLLTTPSINDAGMDVELMSGPIIDNHSATINGGYFPEHADVLLMPPLINSSYTYYWHLSTSSYPNWHPKLEYANGSHAVIEIPQPTSSSTLYIQCFVYNGSSLVDVPSFTFTVNP